MGKPFSLTSIMPNLAAVYAAAMEGWPANTAASGHDRGIDVMR